MNVMDWVTDRLAQKSLSKCEACLSDLCLWWPVIGLVRENSDSLLENTLIYIVGFFIYY